MKGIGIPDSFLRLRDTPHSYSGHSGQVATVNSSENAIGFASAGGSVQVSYRFDTATTATDPGNSKFKLNNATLASVTNIYVNDSTVAAFDIGTLAGFLVAGNRIYIQENDDSSRAALFQVSGAAVDHTGWWTIPVTVVSSATIFNNNAECTFVFMLEV